ASVCAQLSYSNTHKLKQYNTESTERTAATPPIIKGWHTEEGRAKLGLLEYTITRTRLHRFQRGYSCVLAVAVYIPEFNVSRLRSSISQLCHALEEPVTKCSSNNKPLIFVAGDFNGADVRPLCTKFYLRQINREPTRAAKCLDIILSNAPDCYISDTRNPLGPPTSSSQYFNLADEASTNSENNEPSCSDHRIVLAVAPKHLYSATRPSERKILVRSGQLRDTVAAIRQLDTNALLADIETDPHSSINRFMQAIRNAQDLHQPLRIVKTKGDQEWMNVEIKQLIRERQRLHSAGEHILRDQLALRIVGLIATRKATFSREKYTRSKAGMWEHANKLRKPPTTLPPDPEYGERLNEQFSDTVWQGVTQANISRFIRRDALPPVVPVFNFTNVGEQLRNVK
ncbi:RNA-directed DNA polymerase from mobile element jockey, partial [Brachionus plicatilis]